MEGRGPALWEPDAGAEKAEAVKGTRNDPVSMWGHKRAGLGQGPRRVRP